MPLDWLIAFGMVLGLVLVHQPHGFGPPVAATALLVCAWCGCCGFGTAVVEKLRNKVVTLLKRTAAKCLLRCWVDVAEVAGGVVGCELSAVVLDGAWVVRRLLAWAVDWLHWGGG